MIVFPYESYSNYINLPARCLERLSNLRMDDTYFFELKSESKELVYVGVKEFISTDGCVELPCWLSEQLQTDYANITLIKNIPKPSEWNTTPAIAQILDVLCKPFMAFAANRFVIKFLDQSNPAEFLLNMDPPG
jgi:hypothetical protein